MKITQEFIVQRPLEQVWEFFQDVPDVARCLPGAELLTDEGDGVYTGRLEAKMGPMTVSFDGKATVTPSDDAHSGRIEGSGADRRGGSRGRVSVLYTLVEADSGTSVTVDAHVQLSGPAAQFGRVGLIKEMSSRLIDDFVHCLEAKLAAPSEAAAKEITSGAVDGGSLLLGSLWATILRFFRRILKRDEQG